MEEYEGSWRKGKGIESKYDPILLYIYNTLKNNFFINGLVYFGLMFLGRAHSDWGGMAAGNQIRKPRNEIFNHKQAAEKANWK